MSMRIQTEHVRQDEFARELAETDNDDGQGSPLDGDYTLLLDAELVSDNVNIDSNTNPFGSVVDPEVVEGASAEAVEVAPATATEVDQPLLEADHHDEEAVTGTGDVEQNA